MLRINNHEELVRGCYYWVSHKASNFKHLSIEKCCVVYQEQKKLGMHWATPEHSDYLFRHFDIFGPIPEPDTEQLLPAGDWVKVTEGFFQNPPKWIHEPLWISNGHSLQFGKYEWQRGWCPHRLVTAEGFDVTALGYYIKPSNRPELPKI